MSLTVWILVDQATSKIWGAYDSLAAAEAGRDEISINWGAVAQLDLVITTCVVRGAPDPPPPRQLRDLVRDRDGFGYVESLLDGGGAS